MPAAAAWARHLAGAACQGPDGPRSLPCVEPPPGTALSMAEAERVQRYRDRLMAAVQSQDRAALRSAKQAVLEAAFRNPAEDGRPCAGSPAMRRALRDLCWRMAILMLPRHSGG
nr:hypothetical protein [Acidovorax sp. sic0104]